MSSNPRTLVFVSHANPEDDLFSKWLSVQLARHGYRVWCDKTNLLAGENFWNDIEAAIRHHAVKFIYVLSRTSNVKDGPRKELQLALGVARSAQLKDFVIPVLVDDLSPRDFNIHVGPLNAVSFVRGWADGLRAVLEKLELDTVPRDAKYSVETLSQWWRQEHSAQAGLRMTRSDLISNWFQVLSIPSELVVHDAGTQRPALDAQPYPAAQNQSAVFSFQRSHKLGRPVRTVASEEFVASGVEGLIRAEDARRMLTYIVRSAWDKFMAMRGMAIFSLAGRKRAGLFLKGTVANDWLPVALAGVKSNGRAVVGFKTVGPKEQRRKRYWHFGTSANLVHHPVRAVAVRSHVLFSDDGQQIWESESRLHRARRSQCKNWWNPVWRDRLIATVQWLAGNSGVARLPVAEDEFVDVSAEPIRFESPVSYDGPERYNEPDDDSDDDLDDAEEVE